MTGNMIEWQLPSSYHLQKVEFKALASGAHNIHHDFTCVPLFKGFCFNFDYIQ